MQKKANAMMGIGFTIILVTSVFLVIYRLVVPVESIVPIHEAVRLMLICGMLLVNVGLAISVATSHIAKRSAARKAAGERIDAFAPKITKRRKS